MSDTANASLQELLDNITNAVSDVLSCLDWAEEEIKAAMHRHPGDSDTLWHSATLLRPTDYCLLSTEWVFRSHCRELLERVAVGADTRPGTDAEICCMTLAVATRTPIHSAAYGMHMRLWHRAFPGKSILHPEELAHYEAIYGVKMTELEQEARAKLSIQDRVLGTITCSGKHHDVTVNCTYAPAPTLLRSDAAKPTT